VDVRVRAEECMGHAMHEARGHRFQERRKISDVGVARSALL